MQLMTRVDLLYTVLRSSNYENSFD